jgi:hypothetical protein
MTTPDAAAAALLARVGDLVAGSDFESGLLSGLVLLVLGVAGRVFSARSRVAWGNNHQFWFSMPPAPGAPAGSPPANVVTRTIHVMNEGRNESGAPWSRRG